MNKSNKEQITINQLKELGTYHKFKTIYGDPPWSKHQKGKLGAIQHYDLMTLDQIKQMPIGHLAADDALLFLWVTPGLMKEGIEVIESWGFRYVDEMVWDKYYLGLGQRLRHTHEPLLLGVKGKPPILCRNQASLVRAVRQDHSHMLLHGIMSSIAEFYSQNLATEVKKGMGEKVKGGGTVGRAPIGYINVRRVDDKGREERTVELDPERAPLVKQAFEEYATGEWSIISLAEYMAALGLSTRPTPKIPSKPVTKTSIEKMLKNPYYAGVIRYNGIEYDGAHEALIDLETFNKVQNIIQSHHNGERTGEHPHFLKGLVYCWNCKSRMVVTHAKSHTGNVYPYFICAGRHRTKSSRQTCKMRSILIDEVEYQLEKIFDYYTIKPDDRLLLEAQIQGFINKENEKFKTELDALRREKEKIEHKQEKLLEAHFNDAIPMSLMKREQQILSKQLAAIEHEISVRSTTFDDILKNLSLAFDLLEDCGRTYRKANDNIKKLMCQAIFKRIWIHEDGTVTTEFTDIYKNIVGPIERDLINQNIKSAPAETDADFIDKLLKSYSNFFGQGLNNELLVELRGIEPLSESNLTGPSPGADDYLHSLTVARTVTLHGLVASSCMVRAKLSVRTVTTQITPRPGSWSFRDGWAAN